VGVTFRSVRVGGIAVLGLAVTAFTGALASGGVAQAASSSPQLVALADSVSPTTDTITGGYSASQMQIEVALQPSDASGLASTLDSLYNPDSASYQHWLAAGQFDASYAPAAATKDAVSSFLHAGGLTVPGPGHRLKRPGVGRVPYHAEHLQGPARDQLLRQLDPGRDAEQCGW
jgi:hypothetical protein